MGPSSAQRPPSLYQDPRLATSTPTPASTPSPWNMPSTLPRAHRLGFPLQRLRPASNTGAPHQPAGLQALSSQKELSGHRGAPSHHGPPLGPRARFLLWNLLHLHAAFETQLRHPLPPQRILNYSTPPRPFDVVSLHTRLKLSPATIYWQFPSQSPCQARSSLRYFQLPGWCQTCGRLLIFVKQIICPYLSTNTATTVLVQGFSDSSQNY